MKIKILGSAAGGGVPQWNCACSNCAAARAGRLPCRLPAALAVCGNDDRWVLINASGDIRRQLCAVPELQPRERRANPIAALLLTDANIDHVAGVLEFRQADAFKIYSSGLVRKTLCANPLFGQFAHGKKEWRAFEAGNGRIHLDVTQAPQLRIQAVAVPGLLPSYAGGEGKEGAAVAYLFEHAGARLVYAPIFLALGDDLKQELDRADAVFLDGTCWSDEEMIELGLGTRTSRAMGHAPIWGPGGSLHAVAGIRARHRYYTHVNNSNPILDPASPQSRELLQAGFAVADDGLEILLDGSWTKNGRDVAAD